MNTYQCLIILFSVFMRGSSAGLTLVDTFNVGAGTLCTTVLPHSDAPGGLVGEDRIRWYSKPTMMLEMYVETFIGDKFTVRVTAVEIGNDLLTLGDHQINVYNTTKAPKVHTMHVIFDDEYQTPYIQEEKFHTTDSYFKFIKIYSKGPLSFAWGSKCSVPDPPATPEHNEKPREQPFSSPPVSEPTRAHDPVSEPESELSRTSAEPEGLTDHKDQSVLIVGCAVGVAAGLVLVAVLGCLVYNRRKAREEHTRMVVVTKAEQNKQAMIQDAKRLSYQEQLKWAANNPSALSAGTVYYPKDRLQR